MINPADIQIDELPSVELVDRGSLPETPSIYFAVDEQGVIQYIGRSVNPRQRWNRHHRQHQFDDIGGVKIAYIDCPEALLNEVEDALIDWFSPVLNRTQTFSPKLHQSIVPLQHKQSPKNSIQWKLRQVMADRQMTNRALAELVGMHETSISNMKRRDDMPRIDGVLLNGLCVALKCTPYDLIFYSADDEGAIRGGKKGPEQKEGL